MKDFYENILMLSEGDGLHHQVVNDHGVIMLDTPKRPLDIVYECEDFKKWESLLEERINYYTKKKTLAGRIANYSYHRAEMLNNRNKDEYILDIGCGDGAILNYVKKKDTYIGIDKSIKRLNILKSKFPEAIAIYADSSCLPFRDKSIKYIYSSHAFEHLWYLGETILECQRCLKIDGTMEITIPTEGGLWNVGRFLFSRPYFKRICPELDFEYISHIEHTNIASQVIRTLETFFEAKVKYYPLKIPSIYLNTTVSIMCTQKVKCR